MSASDVLDGGRVPPPLPFVLDGGLLGPPGTGGMGRHRLGSRPPPAPTSTASPPRHPHLLSVCIPTKTPFPRDWGTGTAGGHRS